MRNPAFAGSALDAAALATLMAAVLAPMRVEANESFAAKASNQRLGRVQLGRVAAQAHVAIGEPRRESVSAHPPSWLVCSYQVRGHLELLQHERVARIEPGDVTFYTTDHPYEMRFGGVYELLAVCIPLESARSSALGVDRIGGIRLDRGDPVVAAVAGVFDSVERNIAQAPPHVQPRLISHVLETVETLALHAGAIAGATPPTTDFDREPDAVRALVGRAERADLLNRALERIDERLADPRLDAASLAGELFVSSRTLFGAFQDAGLSLAGTIRSRRLERCRQALTDPVRCNDSVSTICTSLGFSSPSHFSVLFREAFGASPSEYRVRFIA